MIVSVTGHGMSAGQYIKEYIEEKSNIVKKYIPNAIDFKVIFNKNAFYHHVSITVNPGIKGNVFLKSDSQSIDPYDAFDQALKKIEGKMRRYKDKLKHRHVNENKTEEKQSAFSNGVDVRNYIIHYDHYHDSDVKINIKNKEIKNLQTISIEDAVMHMDFESKNYYIFVNKENNKFTLLIKEHDGSIDCVEV